MVSTKNCSGKVQFFEQGQRFRVVFSVNQICKIFSDQAQSDGKSVNRELPVLGLPEVAILGADLVARSAMSGDENG